MKRALVLIPVFAASCSTEDTQSDLANVNGNKDFSQLECRAIGGPEQNYAPFRRDGLRLGTGMSYSNCMQAIQTARYDKLCAVEGSYYFVYSISRGHRVGTGTPSFEGCQQLILNSRPEVLCTIQGSYYVPTRQHDLVMIGSAMTLDRCLRSTNGLTRGQLCAAQSINGPIFYPTDLGTGRIQGQGYEFERCLRVVRGEDNPPPPPPADVVVEETRRVVRDLPKGDIGIAEQVNVQHQGRARDIELRLAFEGVIKTQRMRIRLALPNGNSLYLDAYGTWSKNPNNGRDIFHVTSEQNPALRQALRGMPARGLWSIVVSDLARQQPTVRWQNFTFKLTVSSRNVR